MGSVRADVGVPAEQSRLESVRTQAIRIGPGLLADLDSAVRAQFLRRWSQIFDPGAKASADFRPRTHSPLQLGGGSETGQLP